MALPSSLKGQVIMFRLVVGTVVCNLSVACSFAVGSWVARLIIGWSGRDVTLIML